jgi:glycolate oxidase
VVVPRAAIPVYMARVSEIAQAHQTLVIGCGHAGDGNVHLSVFQPDADVRGRVIKGILKAGMDLGGAISAEHGIGSEKMAYFLELEDPKKLALMRGIKQLFDPKNILNPGALLG